ncbi:MAG: hypothetical protein IPH60_10920 [Flavobacteriales bacterium]|nr:hypothetical protein [Flavobacteriales bacterium]
MDYYLNAYSKADIKKMRKQVNIWHMNFDKLMRATIRDLRTYSEGGAWYHARTTSPCRPHGMERHTP